MRVACAIGEVVVTAICGEAMRRQWGRSRARRKRCTTGERAATPATACTRQQRSTAVQPVWPRAPLVKPGPRPPPNHTREGARSSSSIWPRSAANSNSPAAAGATAMVVIPHATRPRLPLPADRTGKSHQRCRFRQTLHGVLLKRRAPGAAMATCQPASAAPSGASAGPVAAPQTHPTQRHRLLVGAGEPPDWRTSANQVIRGRR